MASELAGVVGRNIAAARIEKGIGTQRELAALLAEEDPEMAPSNTRVSVWERGEEKPGDRYMRSLVKVLDKSTDWFYTDHQKPGKSETPNPFPSEEATQLDRIEAKLDTILAFIGPLDVDRLMALLQAAAEQIEPPEGEERPGRAA